MSRALLLCLLVSVSAPAMAVYKCESRGKTTYSDTPCVEGKSQELSNRQIVTASESDTAEAQRQLAQDKREARRLESARLRREAAEEKERSRIAKAHASKKKQCASLALRKKWSDEDAADAAGKSAEKARRNARRAAEKYELECGT
jgi:hypothetical protein